MATTATVEPSTTSSTNAIKTSSSSVVAANSLIQLYINTVCGTPDIDLSSVNFADADKHIIVDLPKHQQLARANAFSFIDGPNSVNSLMVGTLSDIIGFSNQFESRYQRLIALANDFNTGNNKQIFEEGLQGLINSITQKEANCGVVITKLGDFLKLIQTDSQNLTADENIIKATLDGENGAITQLQNRISSINEAMNKDNAMIAGGAVMTVVGVLMITVGVLGEFETGGASTALVLGGLAVMGGGIAMDVVAGMDLSKKMDEYKDATTELTKDQQISSCLIQASQTVQSLVDSINNAMGAITNLQSGWSSLKGDLDQVIDALNDAESDEGTSWVIDDLNAAKADWEDAKTLAVQLQANGTLQVKHTNPMDYDPTGAQLN
jgi:non-hemolytic enterotoxin B/C